MAKISKRTVDGLESRGKEERIWDDELKGFCVRAYPTGRKVYAVKYRTAQQQQRWHTIGTHGSPWTPDTARAEARRVLNAVVQGEDPAAAKAERKKDMTVAQLIDAYLQDGPASKPGKRESTWAIDASNLNRHVRPLLGRRIGRDLSSGDCSRLVADITAGKTRKDERTGPRGRAIVKGGAGTAARVLGTTAAMFAWAKGQGLIDTIPTHGVRAPLGLAKERFLSPKEAERLLQTIAVMTEERRLTDTHADIFRLLLLTGARRSEISGLRWAEVDLERCRLTLPPERTKAGGKTGVRRITLSRGALAVLTARRTSDGVFVFPSSKDATKPSSALQKAWNRVRSEAGLSDVRIHDLRHTFASLALAKGASLPLIGKALGHSTSRVTERYAHLADDAMQALVENIGDDLRGPSQ
ncbi:site-specific integrase [uncultured Brevundimonas sp.]|uniref:tyrosine-type recombinase/integrase n=1 Tax=uncultured Brevundimonas sp. TaxID=213418 RepID=UPI0025960A91|nr:site-specific integrase [uncultured Brevundimonas sp.]